MEDKVVKMELYTMKEFSKKVGYSNTAIRKFIASGVLKEKTGGVLVECIGAKMYHLPK